MSKPQFSRKRKGKRVDPYPLGTKEKAKASQTKKNVGRPRSPVSEAPKDLEELNELIEELEADISHWEGILNEDEDEVDEEDVQIADAMSERGMAKLTILYKAKTDLLLTEGMLAGTGGAIFKEYYKDGLGYNEPGIKELTQEMMVEERKWAKDQPTDKEAQGLIKEFDSLPKGNEKYAWRKYFRVNSSHGEYAGLVVGYFVGAEDFEEASYLLEICRGDRFGWDT